jgi:hypothetical protein
MQGAGLPQAKAGLRAFWLQETIFLKPGKSMFSMGSRAYLLSIIRRGAARKKIKGAGAPFFGSKVVVVKLYGAFTECVSVAVFAAPLAIFLEADAEDVCFWVAGDFPALPVLVSEVPDEAASLEAHAFGGVGAHCVHGADFDGLVANVAHDLKGAHV